MKTGNASVIFAPIAKLSTHRVNPSISVRPARIIRPSRAASLPILSTTADRIKKLAQATRQVPTDSKNVPTITLCYRNWHKFVPVPSKYAV